MDTTKPFWASKTLWVNALATLAAITGSMGIDVGLDAKTQIAIIGGVMAIINIVLRFMTRSAVVGSSK